MKKLLDLEKLEKLDFVKIGNVNGIGEYVMYPVPSSADIRISIYYDSNKNKVILPGVIEKLGKGPKKYNDFEEFYNIIKKMKKKDK